MRETDHEFLTSSEVVREVVWQEETIVIDHRAVQRVRVGIGAQW